MAYRSHKRHPDKQRQVAGWKAALNNPSTTKEGRRHARKMLLFVSMVDATRWTPTGLAAQITEEMEIWRG